MENLIKGVKEFKKHEFERLRPLYKKLSEKQNPHTLFITCSDSRIDANLITSSLPGELFIIRNIANIVPSYENSFKLLSTASAIEYAVKVLKVKNIVICGHSNCGGCRGLYLSDDINDLPYTKKWLELSGLLKEKIDKIKNDFDINKDYWLLEQENIIVQIKNLLSYPYIRKNYENNLLKIYGWYYHIEEGTFYNYSKRKESFEKILG